MVNVPLMDLNKRQLIQLTGLNGRQTAVFFVLITLQVFGASTAHCSAGTSHETEKGFMGKKISISTDKSLLNIDLIHNFLSNSYWAKEIPLEIVKKSIDHSLCFGVYEGQEQVRFARVITDYACFAYIADVFIIPDNQGRGLGKKLMKFIMEFPEFAGLRRWHLLTLDAQELYKQFGFSNPESPEYHMEIKNLNIYKTG